jgi:hypothetical protein
MDQSESAQNPSPVIFLGHRSDYILLALSYRNSFFSQREIVFLPFHHEGEVGGGGAAEVEHGGGAGVFDLIFFGFFTDLVV